MSLMDRYVVVDAETDPGFVNLRLMPSEELPTVKLRRGEKKKSKLTHRFSFAGRSSSTADGKRGQLVLFDASGDEAGQVFRPSSAAPADESSDERDDLLVLKRVTFTKNSRPRSISNGTVIANSKRQAFGWIVYLPALLFQLCNIEAA
ncbi:hypothetical protein Ciccas_002050 [Cichlidogyrus casuarinus]|uniref:Uncharacterized protein n=1 Tax=Cichlidogyrus casuarinus TaxID=1844966 RepID=A0ABD2QIB9_9PLAT